jgi:hypothetical protein
VSRSLRMRVGALLTVVVTAVSILVGPRPAAAATFCPYTLTVGSYYVGGGYIEWLYFPYVGGTYNIHFQQQYRDGGFVFRWGTFIYQYGSGGGTMVGGRYNQEGEGWAPSGWVSIMYLC